MQTAPMTSPQEEENFNADKMEYNHTSDINRIFEPNMFEKKSIPINFEANPLSDRNHYMRSPQFRFSCERGDLDVDKHQSRTMNRRFKM